MLTSGKTPVVQQPVAWIVLGGLVLRLWNIQWSLPDVYEEAYPFSIAWKFWNWGAAGLDFNLHFFNYPALTFYLNFAVQALHYLAGSLTGTYPSPEAFSQAYGTDPSSFIVMGRMVSVLFDAGTIYCAYRLGEAIGGKRVGAVAGILLAVNPLHIRQAHLINVDTPLTFFIVLALYLLHRAVMSPKPGRYILFGVAAGLAAASKYTGAVLLAAFAIVAAVSWVRKSASRPTIRETLTTIVSAGLVFLLFNPYAILNLNEFLADVGFERFHAGYGHLGLDASESTPGFYLLGVLPDALGMPLVAILAATIVLVAVRRDWRLSIPLLFAAVYLAGIVLWEMRADRYFLPVIPVFIVVCAYGIVAFADMAQRWFAGRVPRAAALGVLVAAAAAVPVSSVWTYHRSFEKKDTRTLAREFIQKNLPGGSAIVLSPMGINLGTRYPIVILPFNPVETERLTPFYDARWYSGFDLAVMSDYDQARYRKEPERFRDILRFYDGLKNGGPALAEFVPEEHQPGPRIWIVGLGGRDDQAAYPQELFANLASVGHDETVLAFLNNLGNALFAKERLSKCRQVLSAGLTGAPGDPRFLIGMAWTCFRMGDYPAAGKAVDDVLRVQPDRPEMVSLKGSVLLNLGQPAEAESWLLRALSMNDRLLSAYIDLSEAAARQGKADLAMGALERVLSMVTPGGPEASDIMERMNKLRKGARP